MRLYEVRPAWWSSVPLVLADDFPYYRMHRLALGSSRTSRELRERLFSDLLLDNDPTK